MKEFSQHIHIGWPWLIKGLNKEEVEYLTEGIPPIFFKKDSFIVKNLDPYDYLYIIKTGLVQLEVSDPNGDIKTVLYASEGHTIFESAAVLHQNTELINAFTIKDTYVYKIPFELFKMRLNNNLPVLWSVMRIIATKGNIWLNQIKMLSLGNSRDRVKKVLYWYFTTYGEKTENGHILPKKIGLVTITHKHISEIAGLTRVSVSNSFAELYRDNILEHNQKYYYVKSLESLEK